MIGAENALLLDGLVILVLGVTGVSARVVGGVAAAAAAVAAAAAAAAAASCFCWLLDFLLSFLVGGGGGGGSAGGAGVSSEASSTGSFPLRFFPCLLHGNNGVARTRTSHGNL